MDSLKSQGYHFYCGKFRKPAVRTFPTALNSNNSVVKDNHFDGKIRKLSECKDGSETSKKNLVSKPGTKNTHQVFDEMSEREKTEKNQLIPASSVTNYTSILKGTTNTNMGFNSKSNSGFNVVYERKKLLNEFRKACAKYRKKVGGLTKRIDRMAYDDGKKTGELFINQKTIGPIPGVEVGDCFDYRFELIIMGIHTHELRGIDFKETSNGRILATSIVATEGYGDDLMKPDMLVYTGEGGGTFESACNKGGPKDQELKGGNLAMKNSAKDRNFVRVVRGIKSKRNDLKSATTFVFDGLYKVVDSAKELGPNGKMQFKFTMKRCLGQKAISWWKFK